MTADMLCAAPAAAAVPSAQEDRPDIHTGEQERDDAAEGKLNPVEDVLPAANSLTCIIYACHMSYRGMSKLIRALYEQ